MKRGSRYPPVRPDPVWNTCYSTRSWRPSALWAKRRWACSRGIWKFLPQANPCSMLFCLSVLLYLDGASTVAELLGVAHPITQQRGTCHFVESVLDARCWELRNRIVTHSGPLLSWRIGPRAPPPLLSDPKSVAVQVLYIKRDLGASKMAPWVKAVATKPVTT